MKTFYINATSTEWCGIACSYIVEAPDHYTEEDIRDNVTLAARIDEDMYEEVSSRDDEDEDEESEYTWGYETVEETTDPEIINCAAYETVTLE